MAKSVIDKYRTRLRALFLTSPKSKTIDDFREELLEALMERYTSNLEKGMSPDKAYVNAWDELREFKAAIKEIKKQVLYENQEKRIKQFALGTIVYFMAIVLGFLITSFATQDWSWSWQITVMGALVYVFAINTLLFIINRAKYKNVLASINLLIATMTVATILYIFCGFWFDLWHPTWIIFIVGLLVSYVTDLLYLWNNKKRLVRKIDLTIITLLFTIILYLVFSYITKRWNYSWMVFVIFVFIFMIVELFDMTITQNKHNKELSNNDKQNSEIDENENNIDLTNDNDNNDNNIKN